MGFLLLFVVVSFTLSEKRCFVVFIAVHTVLAILLTIMAIQDWKTTYVNGWLYLVGWVTLLGGMTLVGAHPLAYPVYMVFLALTYIPVEFPGIGDADFQIFAMLFCLYAAHPRAYTIFITFLVVNIISFVVSAKLWYAKQGKVWRYSDHLPAPAIPSFAVAWWTLLFIVV